MATDTTFFRPIARVSPISRRKQRLDRRAVNVICVLLLDPIRLHSVDLALLDASGIRTPDANLYLVRYKQRSTLCGLSCPQRTFHNRSIGEILMSILSLSGSSEGQG